MLLFHWVQGRRTRWGRVLELPTCVLPPVVLENQAHIQECLCYTNTDKKRNPGTIARGFVNVVLNQFAALRFLPRRKWYGGQGPLMASSQFLSWRAAET